MITIYEQLKRAKKGDVLYTLLPARNVTSAASRIGRRVTTEQGMYVPSGHYVTPKQYAHLIRVTVKS